MLKRKKAAWSISRFHAAFLNQGLIEKERKFGFELRIAIYMKNRLNTIISA
ncbi:hypothetical protein [Paenibacillus sp. NPDC058071]|uniref:hypothetical protein n=1 Tax=Paenibacillus sp. NPDC058071 TaxID=3346326 RepID=UPI0036D8EC4A